LRCQNGKRLKFLTNNFTLPALTIAQIYIYTVPTEPQRCPFCKHIGLYGPKDGHFFRLVVPTPTDTAPDLT
jgi:hypothetical protein